MKSDVIIIDNEGNGFGVAVKETKKVATYRELGKKDSLQLQLLAEEILSMARSVTGELQASFWIESEGEKIDLHMTTETVMDTEKRNNLLSAASSRKNEEATGLLGKLRDAFEQAMTRKEKPRSGDLSAEIYSDICYSCVEDPEWDGYEGSVLRKLADDVKVGIRGRFVELTVSKSFVK